MPLGKVKWFNNAKGYGFIIEDGGTEDLFAHFSSIQMEGYKTLKAGQAVEFEKQPSNKGTHAINIVAVAGEVSETSAEHADTSQGNMTSDNSPPGSPQATIHEETREALSA
ncbi:cold shock protein [Oleiphilus messinensis]|uniref:Cold shock protein n=1 Tax=Oleiphilus messinensis TaxID=141451 RepID=A0A1Y0I9R8_9GAMM|nr:cold shock domain-containing protein [Oleiphilus messinensis]ARU56133.1 cold shock protein [Oleiphilus messinensis]